MARKSTIKQEAYEAIRENHEIETETATIIETDNETMFMQFPNFRSSQNIFRKSRNSLWSPIVSRPRNSWIYLTFPRQTLRKEMNL